MAHARAARAENADPAVFAEAAAVRRRMPGPRPCCARAWPRASRRGPAAPRWSTFRCAGGRKKRPRSPKPPCWTPPRVIRAPGPALREAAAGWTLAPGARRARRRKRALGAPPPPEARLALAAWCRGPADPVELSRRRARHWVTRGSTPSSTDVPRRRTCSPWGGARTRAAGGSWCRAGAPAAPPLGNLPACSLGARARHARRPDRLAPAAGRTRRRGLRPSAAGGGDGRVQRRKSSFVNALCGADVAPTGVTPTTATINVLRYGATPEARVVHHDGRPARSRPPTSRLFWPRCATPTRARYEWWRSSSRRGASSRRDRRHAWLELDSPRARAGGPRLPARRRRHRLGVRRRAGRQGRQSGRPCPWRTQPASGSSASSTRSTVRSRRGERARSPRRRVAGRYFNPVVPFSATRATAAQKQGRADSAWRR